MTQKWQIFQTRVRAASFINIFGRHCLPFFTTLYKIMDLNVFQDNYKKQHEEKFKKINVVLFVYVWGGDELSVIIGSRIYRRCVPPPFFFPSVIHRVMKLAKTHPDAECYMREREVNSRSLKLAWFRKRMC